MEGFEQMRFYKVLGPFLRSAKNSVTTQILLYTLQPVLTIAVQWGSVALQHSYQIVKLASHEMGLATNLYLYPFSFKMVLQTFNELPTYLS